MTGVLRWILIKEISAAVRLGALGDWWAASAVRRLRKLSASSPGGGK
ncbi:MULTISPECIES: hypothetical protein [Pseudosulfitobacter]|nr:hypothetical protein [Pseudosulfitobacter pseudonitzschiae]QKS08548.1 hypothetical protein HT745_08695 [Pseudosulfitobacter pseudonitzschiae]